MTTPRPIRRNLEELLNAYQEHPDRLTGLLTAVLRILEENPATPATIIAEAVGLNPDAAPQKPLPPASAGIHYYPSKCPALLAVKINQAAKGAVFTSHMLRQIACWSFGLPLPPKGPPPSGREYEN